MESRVTRRSSCAGRRGRGRVGAAVAITEAAAPLIASALLADREPGAVNHDGRAMNPRGEGGNDHATT